MNHDSERRGHQDAPENRVSLIEILRRYQGPFVTAPSMQVEEMTGVVFRPSKPVAPHEVSRHLFGQFAEDGRCQTPLLYNIGVFLPRLDPVTLS